MIEVTPQKRLIRNSTTKKIIDVIKATQRKSNGVGLKWDKWNLLLKNINIKRKQKSLFIKQKIDSTIDQFKDYFLQQPN